jgi:parallel beta-helix repeat protein
MKPLSKHTVAAALLLAIFCAPHAVLAQGSLTPSGPPAPIYKTLDQVAPRTPISATTTPGDSSSLYVISNPGSYYLTTNITGVANKNGIKITASGVTLDLMGFELAGVPNSAVGIVNGGIQRTNNAVRNGTVRSWGSAGIDMGDSSIFEGLRVSGNGDDGLTCGDHAIIRNCTATYNHTIGLDVYSGVIQGCNASFNGNSGVVIGPGTVSGCVCDNNGGTGIDAYFKDGPASVINCIADANSFDGIDLSNGSAVNCAAKLNGEYGFLVTRSTVRGCTAYNNNFAGIVSHGQSYLIDNLCTGNGSASAIPGILADGSGNRIESNAVRDNGLGIKVTSSGNLVLRNSASNNGTNYVISASNRYGPIVDLTATGTAAVNGNSASSTVSTTDPWANFAH